MPKSLKSSRALRSLDKTTQNKSNINAWVYIYIYIHIHIRILYIYIYMCVCVCAQLHTYQTHRRNHMKSRKSKTPRPWQIKTPQTSSNTKTQHDKVPRAGSAAAWPLAAALTPTTPQISRFKHAFRLINGATKLLTYFTPRIPWALGGGCTVGVRV